jgi:hypothetical protein
VRSRSGRGRGGGRARRAGVALRSGMRRACARFEGAVRRCGVRPAGRGRL